MPQIAKMVMLTANRPKSRFDWSPTVPPTFREEPAFSRNLADYEFLGLAGQGQFSEVWQAREKPTGRIVAFKQLVSEWETHPAARQLLENEAEVGRKVRSPYVVRVFECQTETAPRYSLLEWLDGTSLEKVIEVQSQFTERRALWIARQAAQGLLDLADAGFSHGDVKPGNICLLVDGRLKLIDLGFAQSLHDSSSHGTRAKSALAGTPEYLAPEALASTPADAVVKDIYSLGVLLYRMLAGRLPFQDETVAGVLRQQQRAVAVPLRNFAPQVTRETADLVTRLLSKQPLRRGIRWNEIVRELVSREIALLP